MDFQPVKASDKEIIDKYMKKANSCRGCGTGNRSTDTCKRIFGIRP